MIRFGNLALLLQQTNEQAAWPPWCCGGFARSRQAHGHPDRRPATANTSCRCMRTATSSRCQTSSFDGSLRRRRRAKSGPCFLSPTANAFIRDDNPALQKHFFNITQAEPKTVVQPDSMGDDFNREPMVLVAGRGSGHAPRPTDNPLTRKQCDNSAEGAKFVMLLASPLA